MESSRIEAGAIRLDGHLDEPEWKSARPVSGLTQYAPQAGDEATEGIEARVLVSTTAMYVGMRLFDEQPDAIDARLDRRDVQQNTDAAMVLIDSYDDDRTAFAFQITPAGVKRDLVWFDDIREDDSWDAVWDAEVSLDESGWAAEFEIPLSQLRFAGGDGPHNWGIQFARQHFRTGETSYWAPILPEVFGRVSRFGQLIIPGPLRAPQAVEIQPYVAGALTRAPGDRADPFYDEIDADPSAGVDFKIGLSSDLRLTGTINPDFGQVEADPAQINLTAYELFFPERRPFFVEGLDVFNYGRIRSFFNMNRPVYLYTRRIGRSPQRFTFVPGSAYESAGDDGVVYTDRPGQTTILGAAKMTGRVGAFTVGVLDALTAPEYGRFAVVGPDGAMRLEDRDVIEPTSNYFVSRARGRFGRTQVGGIVTGVSRAQESALADLLPSQEWVVGFDGEHALSDEWIVSGLASGSRVLGSESAILDLQRDFIRLYQRPDARHLSVDPTRTALSGAAAEIALAKVSGTHWRGSISAAYTSPGFESNALGFQSRADQAYIGVAALYDETEMGAVFRNWRAWVWSALGSSLGGDRTHSFVGWSTNGQLRNFWQVGFQGFGSLRTVNERIARGGPLWTDPLTLSGTLNLTTDARNPVYSTSIVQGTIDEIGGSILGGSTTVVARPRPNLSVSVGPSLTRTISPVQYVTAFDDPAATATFGRRYVFGRIDRIDAALESRVDWTFSPEVSLQLFLRPLISTGRYTDYRELDRPRAMALPVYGVDMGTTMLNADGSTTIDPGDGGEPFTIADNDFTFRALQGNAVLRWEYRPGSAFFFVWQQQRSRYLVDDGRFRQRDVSELFTDPGQNVFLVKFSYWFAR
ncbi:MAG: DUF5916 domain-containing protein [Bacteroidota bacterium]